MRDRYRCQWGSVPEDEAVPGQCSVRATDADHIGNPEDHSMGNLRALCGPHHRLRTSRMAGLSSGAKKRERNELKKRPQGKHPGMVEEENND